jgi:hypothetical protein
MKRAPNQQLEAVVHAAAEAAARVELAAAEAVAALIVTETVIATVAAAVDEAAAKGAGSRPRIIAIVPGNRANLAGNSQPVSVVMPAVRMRFHTRRLVWLRRNPRFRSAKKR